MRVRSLIIWVIVSTTICIFFSCSERADNSSFVKLPSNFTGIDFRNDLLPSDSMNIIEYLYYYNGGGVAIGDINNDGFSDIYFSSNQQGNKLYLNKGDFRFEDITDAAGVKGKGNWNTGISLIDVNGDGYLDIFSCAVGGYKNLTGSNSLYINNGDLTFTDRTNDVGLSFQGFATQGYFFDYDADGDLDLYLLNHAVHTPRSYGDVRLRLQSDSKAGDRMYKNMLMETSHLQFNDVTDEAGIYHSQIGYGLSAAIGDLNLDGLPDIYVANDFHENDYLYLNQGNGKFDQVAEEAFYYTSRFSMGTDIGDLNNDGLSDLISLDMLPDRWDIVRTTAGEDAFDIYDYKRSFGYHDQLSRNCLQWNKGVIHGIPRFVEAAAFAGLEATDWSWSVLLADFDNDSFRDVFISNGIVGRPNDLDYVNFVTSRSSKSAMHGYREYVNRMPSGSAQDFMFHNVGSGRFDNVSENWIGEEERFSSGAAYGDLDNDGDLDLVINIINAEAAILRNQIPQDNNFLRLRLRASGKNTFAIGAKVVVHTNMGAQHFENYVTRGWLSSVEPILHIGLPKDSRLDSIIINWPNGYRQSLTHLTPGSLHDIVQKGSMRRGAFLPENKTFLKEVAAADFRHQENTTVVFMYERTMPRAASELGPAMAVGDINGDQLDDLFFGGGPGQKSLLFKQTPQGTFVKDPTNDFSPDALPENVDAAIFDANNDGSNDLLIVGGGQDLEGDAPALIPRLYLNDGTGKLTQASTSLPAIYVDASCVAASDIDRDGDIDIFIGGRAHARHYERDPASFLLLNDGRGNFADVTINRLGTRALGLVTDAEWADVNGDGKQDLVVAGEWSSIQILYQDDHGIFNNDRIGLGGKGWWNCVLVEDVDNDGDMDILAGNVGENHRLKPSKAEPVKLYSADIDGNGSYDHILSHYVDGTEVPFASKDLLVKQVPILKKRFLRYNDFKSTTTKELLTKFNGQTIVRAAESFQSLLFVNDGKGRFTPRPLPGDAQLFPIMSFCTVDLNQDGFKDILAAGNLSAAQPDLGFDMHGYGIALLSNSNLSLKSLSFDKSGFFVPGEARKIVKVKSALNKTTIIVSRNNDLPLQFILD